MTTPNKLASIKNLAAELDQDFMSARLVPGLTSGLVVGLVEVIIAISFATLIFAGELSSFLPNGIGFALIGAIITGVVVALMTSLPGTVSGIQDAPAAILAVMSAAIVTSMPSDASGLETFITIVVAIALTTILCGIFMLGAPKKRAAAATLFHQFPYSSKRS